jgi:hypothetical protein
VEAVAVLASTVRSVEVDDDVVVEVDDVVPLEAGDGDCAVTVSAFCMVSFIITIELFPRYNIAMVCRAVICL